MRGRLRRLEERSGSKVSVPVVALEEYGSPGLFSVYGVDGLLTEEQVRERFSGRVILFTVFDHDAEDIDH